METKEKKENFAVKLKRVQKFFGWGAVISICFAWAYYKLVAEISYNSSFLWSIHVLLFVIALVTFVSAIVLSLFRFFYKE